MRFGGSALAHALHLRRSFHCKREVKPRLANACGLVRPEEVRVQHETAELQRSAWAQRFMVRSRIARAKRSAAPSAKPANTEGSTSSSSSSTGDP